MGNFLQSIIDRDPAAKSKLSLILTYPGVKAVFFHRIANFFSVAKFGLVARIISQFSRPNLTPINFLSSSHFLMSEIQSPTTATTHLY